MEKLTTTQLVGAGWCVSSKEYVFQNAKGKAKEAQKRMSRATDTVPDAYGCDPKQRILTWRAWEP